MEVVPLYMLEAIELNIPLISLVTGSIPTAETEFKVG